MSERANLFNWPHLWPAFRVCSRGRFYADFRAKGVPTRAGDDCAESVRLGVGGSLACGAPAGGQLAQRTARGKRVQGK